ncbi:MAG: SMP-30/gluconolactonase/LRE family protein [Alphaproteobacteria bacterium]
MWQPSQRYPDPSVRVLDRSFEKYVVTLTGVEKLADGCKWSEGPVWFGDGRYVLWSDIPNNRIMRWDEATGAVSAFRQPSNHANGNTRDRQGRLVTCEHSGRRVTRTEYDGSITVLADSYNGKRLNSPNDVVVAPDGAVWFTDPPFGIRDNYMGVAAVSETAPALYRIDAQTGRLAVMADDIPGPNGLAFSPDGKLLYVVASRAEPNRTILSFDVTGDGTRLGKKRRTLIDAQGGTPDGFRVDLDGNLWCGWGMGNAELDGVRIFNPAGQPIGHIDLPERCANVCFGGRHRNRLFMAASHSLYALYVNTAGVAGG